MSDIREASYMKRADAERHRSLCFSCCHYRTCVAKKAYCPPYSTCIRYLEGDMTLKADLRQWRADGHTPLDYCFICPKRCKLPKYPLDWKEIMALRSPKSLEHRSPMRGPNVPEAIVCRAMICILTEVPCPTDITPSPTPSDKSSL